MTPQEFRGTTMVRKILTTLVAVPLAILLAVFMIANRHAVTLSLDPFGSGAPSLSATLPLFVIILVCLLVGVIAGGTAAWLNQSRWRRAARGLRVEREALRGRLAAKEPMTLPARRTG
jgi:predicted ribosomally synthesized peptide with SipW-like signal peptide